MGRISLQKAPNTYRILVVGSSFVEGIQVPLDERFDTILERELNARGGPIHYEVVGLGFPANGTYLSMIYYQDYYAALHPDLVIDLVTDSSLGKDAPDTTNAPQFDANGSPILALSALKQDSSFIALKSAARQSKLFDALYQDYQIAKTTLDGTAATSTETSATLLATSWDSEAKLFPAFASSVESSGARFMVASWTSDDLADPSYMSDHLSPILASAHVPYLDLTPALDEDEQKTGESAMLPCNGHWGIYGHQWVAGALDAYLTAHPSLL